MVNIAKAKMQMFKEEHQKILFVSHKANRSGAPLLLLEIIKEFKKQSKIPFHILVMEDGDLTNEFKLLGKTYVWNNHKTLNPTSLFSIPKNLVSRLYTTARSAFILFHLRNTSLVFLNTISNGHIHKKLLFLKSKFICYVHELQAAIHITTNPQSLQIVLNNTDLFIACSEAVKNNLVVNHAVSKDIIKAMPTSLPVVYRNKNDYADVVSNFKLKNVVHTDAIVIGVVASNEWRKGFDLFFSLVLIYSNLFPDSNVVFVWKGLNMNTASSFFDLYDNKNIKQTKQILLLSHGADSIENMACFDIHLLLSREDPYPLVVLEAASLGIPTICFLGAGGSPEFIEDDCGYCVPYGDLIKMATSINELVLDDELRNKMGLKAQEKVKARHAHETAMPPFISILES